MHPHEDFTGSRGGPLGFNDFQHLGTSEGPLADHSHAWHGAILTAPVSTVK
nr:hypothetical protein [uncultured bacterium]